LNRDMKDLRTALALLRTLPGELVETDVSVSLQAELAGVYRHVGAGGTIMRPTKSGPAMLFNTIEGHPGARVVIGILSSRSRVSRLLGIKSERLGLALRDCVNNPINPIEVTKDKAICQENIHLATNPDFDLRQLIPAPTNTPLDAGPYITMGMCYASHPETHVSDITIHRICIQGKDELSIFFQPGSRHIGAMASRASEMGRALPISISIGVDPAIEIATSFEPPITPFGFNELSIAGALRNQAVELVKCVSINEKAIARAEYVIEGEILPGIKVREDKNTGTGYAMPEFPGYTGLASDSCSLIRVKAVTHRHNPIMQACIGPSEEHVNMVGIPTEASIIDMVEKAMPGRLQNVYIWRCSNLKRRQQAMKADNVRLPCWHFQRSPN
jgi:UbiD family decarboxylase